MVSTRRSGQRQEGTPDPQSQQHQDSPGPSTSSQRQGSKAAASRGKGTATKAAASKRLEPIEEDTAHHASLQRATDADQAGPGPSSQQQEDGRLAGVTTTTTTRGRPAATASARSSKPPRSQPLPTADSSDDEDDDDILGPNLMGQLAASLRAALHARAGTLEDSAAPEDRPGPSKQVAKKQDEQLGLSCNPESIRWQMDAKPAQEQLTGPQRVAVGIGAEKEKGLAKKLLAPPRTSKPEGPSAGAQATLWHQLPATKITDEVKTELRLLRLRGAYDPKRFYKSFDDSKFPKHFQIGTVMDNPQDFYSGRLTSRERGASITQELLADGAVEASRKKRYSRLQVEATRFQKVKKRKTDLKRDNPKPKRPKH